MTRPLQSQLDLLVASSLKPVATGAAFIMLLVAAAHTIILPPSYSVEMALIAGGVAVAAILLRVVLHRRAVPGRWGNPVVFGLGVLVLVHDSALTVLSGDPAQTTIFGVLVFAAGIFFLSWWWFSGFVVLVWAVWGGLVAVSEPSMAWVHHGSAFVGVTGIAVITHLLRWRGNRQLLAGEERFRELANATFEAVVIHVAGRIEDVNDRARDLFGRSWEQLVGLHVLELLEPDSRASVGAALLDGEEGPFEAVTLRADGSSSPVEIRTRTVPHGKGKAWVSAIRDITEHKAREAELAEALDELRRSNQDLEAFAGVISHDLTAPIQAITGFAESLQEVHGAALGDEGRALVERIRASGERMSVFISEVLDYSRVGRSAVREDPVNLDVVLKHATDNLSAELAQSGAVLTSSPLPTVRGDRVLLTQLLQNLLANALKFRRPVRPEVRVSAHAEGDLWRVCIRDNGIGIDPSQGDRVFRLFVRGPSGEHVPGVGIGLATCEKVVGLHGGRIWVEPTQGPGTTICFTLPAAPPEPIVV